MQGFYYYISMIMDGPRRLKKAEDAHWTRFALEYLARQVPTPCITTAQWTQLLARFGPIHKSFTEMLPPMVWLGSQLYVSGFLCKISCIDVVR